MKWRRICALALSLTLLAGTAMASAAAAGTAETGPVRVWGVVKSVEERSVSLENGDDADPYQKITLNMGDGTVILDAVTGADAALTDLEVGETLYAYVGPAMALSQPPQAYARLVLRGVPADYAPPRYAEVERVTARADGGVDALMSGNIVLHLSAATEMTAHGAKNVPTLADIKPGTMLLSWYSMVLETLPAQAAPSRVMLFPYRYEGYASAGAGTLSVNGKAVALSAAEAPYVTGEGRLMAPVRKFAEALGCQVLWDAAHPSDVVVTRNGEELYRFTAGGTSATVGGDMVRALTCPAAAGWGVTFLCADDLAALHGVKFAR